MFIFVTHGWGPLPGLVGAGLIGLLLQKLGLGVGASLAIAGLALTAFGWWLNAGEPKGRQHRLFWLPLQWTGVLVVLVAVANTPALLIATVVVGGLGYLGARLYLRTEARVFAERHAELKEMGIEFHFDDEDDPGNDIPAIEPEPTSSPSLPERASNVPYPQRIDLIDGAGACAGLDLQVAPTMSRTPIVHSTREDETVQLILNVARIQLTSAQLPGADPTAPPRQRGLADGEGVLVLTDQRLLGLLTASSKRGTAVRFDGEGSGSTVVFAVDRDDLVDVDLTPAKFGKRLHMAALYGLVTVQVTPTHVLDVGERWRFPEHDEIERALKAFVEGESTRVVPANEEQEAEIATTPTVLSTGEHAQEPIGAPSTNGAEATRKPGRLQRALDAALDVIDDLT